MNFTRTDQGEATTLRIEGSLDAISTPELRAVIDALVGDKRKTISVDLSALRLIDSSGVGVLVSLYKRARGYGGKVNVTGLRDQPLAIFKLLRLDKVLVG
jgi:anti-sigma B factor antagonist